MGTNPANRVMHLKSEPVTGSLSFVNFTAFSA